jgi:hypothetical protein
MQTEKKTQTPALVPLTAKMCEWPLDLLLMGVDDFQELTLDLLFVLDDALEGGDGSCDFMNHQVSRYYKLLAFLQQLSKLQHGKV